MEKALNPFQFVVIVLAGWMNQRQQNVIEYLREENRVLREQLGDRRLRFNDDQRCRLAVRAKGLGRKVLMEIATLVTPATLLLGMEEPRKRIAAEMSGLGIHYDLGEGHPLVGRRMPDLDLATANGPLRVYGLLHSARPAAWSISVSTAPSTSLHGQIAFS